MKTISLVFFVFVASAAMSQDFNSMSFGSSGSGTYTAIDYSEGDSVGVVTVFGKSYIKRERNGNGKVYLNYGTKAIWISDYVQDTTILGQKLQVWHTSSGELCIVQESKTGKPYPVALTKPVGNLDDGTNVYKSKKGKFYIFALKSSGAGIYPKYEKKN